MQRKVSLESEKSILRNDNDIRHLFISEFLMKLKLACQAGTDQFHEEEYLHAREAFGSLVMGWRCVNTINIYDHTRNGEKTLSVLADYQKDLSKRRYVPEAAYLPEPRNSQEDVPAPMREETIAANLGETVWLHDAETLTWVKKMQQQTKNM
jgi:hypothetical protein